MFFDDKLGVSLGIRVDQDNFTLNNNFFENLSPRIALSWSISEDDKWKLILHQEDISRYQHTHTWFKN